MNIESLSIVWPWIERLWFPIVFTLLMFGTLSLLFKNYFKQSLLRHEEIIAWLKTIANNIWKDQLSEENSSLVLKLVMHEHIDRKIDYLEWILIENNIQERRDAIEENIKTEFSTITHEEAEKLSKFNCPCWDMWDILLTEINFWDFLRRVYSIFFSSATINKKLEDIRKVMEAEVNKLNNIVSYRSKRFRL